jgi:hypothetical protein
MTERSMLACTDLNPSFKFSIRFIARGNDFIPQYVEKNPLNVTSSGRFFVKIVNFF